MEYLQHHTVHRTSTTEFYLNKETGDIELALPFTQDGVASDMHENGNIQFQISYENGVRHGPMKIFSEEGKLLDECPYHKGRLNGWAYSYEASGTWETLYIADEPQEGYRYRAKGGLERIFKYKNGLLEGDMELYDKNGNIVQTIPYIKGKKQGIGRQKLDNGRYLERIYENDECVGPIKVFDSEGKHIQDIIQEENGQEITKAVIDYDDCGRPASKKENNIFYRFDYKNKKVYANFMNAQNISQGREWVYDVDDSGEIISDSWQDMPNVRYIEGIRVDVANPDNAAQALTDDVMENAHLDSTVEDKFHSQVKEVTALPKGHRSVKSRYSFSTN
jgi:antitoxin component YwqK of YwqJK toxin-antitoxin module